MYYSCCNHCLVGCGVYISVVNQYYIIYIDAIHTIILHSSYNNNISHNSDDKVAMFTKCLSF